MKIAVCDDVLAIASLTKEILMDYKQASVVVDIFTSPQSLISRCEEISYDLFILDIEFPEYSGIDLAEKIRENNIYTPIIFLTNFKEYMEDVFKIQTFDYILKPLNKTKLFPALDRVIKYLALENNRFIFSFNKVSHNIALNQIIYFEKNKRSVIIHTKENSFITIMTTEKLLSMLNENFVQIHTSFIVNSNYIKEMANHYLLVDLGYSKTIELPISQKFIKKAKEQIITKLRKIM
ncbi:MAG: LytTR family DNA-binding domain-containing protein [Lactobacillales bacterium]|nr:LytTR family DNA-binding domain-containing protein [Lactobacillales bacterium]